MLSSDINAHARNDDNSILIYRPFVVASGLIYATQPTPEITKIQPKLIGPPISSVCVCVFP